MFIKTEGNEIGLLSDRVHSLLNVREPRSLDIMGNGKNYAWLRKLFMTPDTRNFTKTATRTVEIVGRYGPSGDWLAGGSEFGTSFGLFCKSPNNMARTEIAQLV